MKKTIALLAILTLGFGFSAQAQQKKAAPAVKAVKALPAPTSEAGVKKAAAADVTTMNGVVTLNDQEKQMFQGLFETKYRNLNEAKSAADKEMVYQSIDAKLRATLSADKMAKLDANAVVLKQLTH